MSSLKDQQFSVVEVLTIACCIFRERGYSSTSTYINTETEGVNTHTNKDMLTFELMPLLAPSNYLLKFEPTVEDVYMAEAAIKYYRKLSFGLMAETLNDYLTRVFTATQNEKVTIKDFGIIASVPQVYERDVAEKTLREEIKTTVNGHLAKEGDEITVNIRYLRTKPVAQLGCWSHEAVTDTGYLVSFLSKNALGVIGNTQKIRAKVKKHGANFITKTPETQLNYVKVVDNEFVWQ